MFSWSPVLSTWWSRVITAWPRSLVGRLRYKMARDRRPLLHVFADKWEARKYVAEKVGPHRLSTVYSMAPSYDELDWSHVPEEFVVKVNHGSGGVIVVTSHASNRSPLPDPDKTGGWVKFVVHPEALDREILGKWVDYWLGRSYRWNKNAYHEWAYSGIHRKVFIEEYLGGEFGMARNMKVHCYSGRAMTVTVTHFGAPNREETEGKFLLSELELASSVSGLSLDEVTSVVHDSEILSRETDFVRVDWLVTPRGIIFGELTNYAGGGFLPPGPSHSLSSAELSQLLSASWNLPRDYRELAQGRYPL